MSRYNIQPTHPEVIEQSILLAGQIGRSWRRVVQPEHARVIQDLVSQARLLTKISLDECNGIMRKEPSGHRHASWSEEDQQRADQSRTIAQKHAMRDVVTLFEAGTMCEFQSDPRGSAIKIITPDGIMFLVDGGQQ